MDKSNHTSISDGGATTSAPAVFKLSQHLNSISLVESAHFLASVWFLRGEEDTLDKPGSSPCQFSLLNFETGS